MEKQDFDLTVQQSIVYVQSSRPYSEENDNDKSNDGQEIYGQFRQLKDKVQKIVEVIRNSDSSSEKVQKIKDIVESIDIVTLNASQEQIQNENEDKYHGLMTSISNSIRGENMEPMLLQVKKMMENLKEENTQLKRQVERLNKQIKGESQEFAQDSIGQQLWNLKQRMSKEVEPQSQQRQLPKLNVVFTRQTQLQRQIQNLKEKLAQKPNNQESEAILKEQIGQLQQQIYHYKEAALNLQSKIKSLNENIRDLQQIIQLNGQKYEQIAIQNSKLKMQLNSLIDEIGDKGRALYDTKTQLQVKIRQIAALQAELSKKVGPVVVNNQSEIAAYKGQIQQYMAKQIETTQKLQQLQKILLEKHQQTKAKSALLQQISGLRQKLSIQSESVKSLEENMNKLRCINDSLKEQVRQQRGRDENYLPSKEQLFRFISTMARQIATRQGRFGFKQQLTIMISSIR